MAALVDIAGLGEVMLTAAGRIDVLRGVALTVEPGEMIAIVGASGVGKSTLLHVVGGLDAFEAGTIRIGESLVHEMNDQARVAFRNRQVGFVFQFHHLLPEFTALENVEMPLRIAGRPAAERHERARALLARVGLTDRLDHKPGTSRAVSNSGWRWRGRWSPGRPCSWPTSRPATRTRRAPPICSSFSATCNAKRGSRRLW